MKRILGILSLALSLSVHAGPLLSFDLQGVVVADLARVILADVADGSVVVDSAVLADRDPISFSLKRVPVEVAVRELERVLSERGFALDKTGGVYRVRNARVVADDVLVYRPKYRSVSYLADLVGGLIPHGSILSQRAVGLPEGQGQPSPSAPQGSATSALGMIDRADKDALVVKGKPETLGLVRKVLAEVDKPVAEMLVKAVVMEVQTGKTEASAVDMIASLVSGGLKVGLNISGGADRRNGVTFKLDRIEALWSAISSDKRFKVVSAPQIRVKSGGSARMAVGADVPVLGAVSYQNNGQPVQSVEYKPSGVILDLRPEIRGELAELKIFQQLSNFMPTQTGVNNSPTLTKRELSTSVVVGENDVVLLGGLDEEKSAQDESGLFFLPSWMRSKGSEVTRSEIVLMLYVERVQAPGERI